MGTVARIHSDGTIDVKPGTASGRQSEMVSRLETTTPHRYDDGDRDTRLKAKYVKPVDSGSDRSRSKEPLREGPKRGRGSEGARRSKGVIRGAIIGRHGFRLRCAACVSDGTMDV